MTTTPPCLSVTSFTEPSFSLARKCHMTYWAITASTLSLCCVMGRGCLNRSISLSLLYFICLFFPIFSLSLVSSYLLPPLTLVYICLLSSLSRVSFLTLSLSLFLISLMPCLSLALSHLLSFVFIDHPSLCRILSISLTLHFLRVLLDFEERLITDSDQSACMWFSCFVTMLLYLPRLHTPLGRSVW